MIGLRWMAIGCVLAVCLTAQRGAAQSAGIGLNFTGATFGVQSDFIPPDTMGAVGPDHIVELINGSYRVYDKSTGAALLGSSLNDFWNASGSGFDGDFTFDPRVLYDPFAQRWYATAVDNKHANNNFLFAVSQSANPLDGWTGYKIDSDTSDTRWADFPQIGYNGEAVVVAAKMLLQPGNTGGAGNAVITVSKADLLAASPSPTFHLLNGNGLSLIRQVQPMVDLDNVTGPVSTFSATLDLSTFGNVIQHSAINNPASATPTTGFPLNIPVTSYTNPPSGTQPTGFVPLHANDDRLGTSVILQNGSYWGVHSVQDPVTGNVGAQWFEIDAVTRATLQDGIIGDSELDLLYPSIAVNDAGDVVIGFSGTGPNTFAGAYAIVGATDGAGLTTFGDIKLLRQGEAGYERIDSKGRNRWGDYSATVVDPIDPSRFWTFQTYALSEDQWAVRVTELNIPEPVGGVLLLLGGAAVLRRRR